MAAAPAFANEEGEGMPHANTRMSNMAAIQRGAKLYFNYCIGCHSLKYMRYARIGEDLGLSEAQVMGSLNATGAKYGDTIVSAMPAVANEPVVASSREASPSPACPPRDSRKARQPRACARSAAAANRP